MKKNLFLIAVLGTMCAGSAQAFDGEGAGTADNPYLVSTATQLQSIKDAPTAAYKLTADIDLGEFAWETINEFSGILDGNGHEIQNLLIANGNNGNGLINTFNRPGEIKNLTIRNFDVTAGSWSGCLASTSGNWEESKKGGRIIGVRAIDCMISGAGYVGIFAGVTGGLYLKDCAAINCTVSGTEAVGGLIGDTEKNPDWEHGVYDCAFYGSINATSNNVGGICAWVNNAGSFVVENSVVYGSLNNTGFISGGIIGSTNWNTPGLQVKNCVSYMDVTGDMVGGLVGRSFGLVMENCYATGKIEALAPAGGRTDEVWSAGLVARSLNSGSIKDGYFSGSGTAANGAFFGGIGGQLNGAALSRLYYNIDGSSAAFGDSSDETAVDVTSMTLEEMLIFSRYQFNNSADWAAVEGGTPILAKQTPAVKITRCDTQEISGTCAADVTEIYLIDESYYFTLKVPVTIENGTFKATLPENTVLENEIISVIAKSGDKIWSPLTQATVAKGSGVESIAIDNQNEDQTIYNLQGMKVTNPTPGVYIKGGKKFVIR